MNIIITGATGFIGKRLLEILIPTNYNIICLLRPQSNCQKIPKHNNVQIIQTTFEKEDLNKKIKDVDIIIHLIGQMGASHITYNQFYEVNCDITSKILSVAIEKNVKQFIYCSTPGVLGFGKRLGEEHEPYAPRNDYEKTKAEAEKTIKQMCLNTHTKYTIIRPDFVYGPGDKRRISMYRLIRDRHFILTTSGKTFLHPTFIDDVVQGFICCISNEHSYNQIFNIAAEEDITSKEYLETIAVCTGSKLIHINIGIMLSHVLSSTIDRTWKLLFHKDGFVSKGKIDFLAIDHSSSIQKAKTYLGYAPQYSFRQGMNLTIQWCKNNNLL